MLLEFVVNESLEIVLIFYWMKVWLEYDSIIINGIGSNWFYYRYVYMYILKKLIIECFYFWYRDLWFGFLYLFFMFLKILESLILK